MSKIEKLLKDGTITIEDLNAAKQLIEQAELAKAGIEACKKTLYFLLGEKTIKCYSRKKDDFGLAETWGTCTFEGIIDFYELVDGKSNKIGSCNLMDFNEVFSSLGNKEFSAELESFLTQQIEKAQYSNSCEKLL